MGEEILHSEAVGSGNVHEASSVIDEIFEHDIERESAKRTFAKFASQQTIYRDEFEDAEVELVDYRLYRSNGKTVALGGLYRYPGKDERTLWIGWMGVARSERGKGLGRRVLEDLEQRASSRHSADRLCVYTAAEDPAYEPARSLYRSTGFVREGEPFAIAVATTTQCEPESGEPPHLLEQRFAKRLKPRPRVSEGADAEAGAIFANSLDQASNMLWSLVIAFSIYSFAELLSKSEGTHTLPSLTVFLRDSAGGLVVTAMIAHNYFTNRLLLSRFASQYKACSMEYGGAFHWLLFAYVASFFGLVAFYPHPALAFTSLTVVGVLATLLANFELRVFDRYRSQTSTTWSDFDEERWSRLVALYRYWRRHDIVIALVGAAGAISFWSFARTDDATARWAFTACVGTLVTFDLCWHRDFHFGGNDVP